MSTMSESRPAPAAEASKGGRAGMLEEPGRLTPLPPPRKKRRLLTPLNLAVGAVVLMAAATATVALVMANGRGGETTILTYHVQPVSFDVKFTLAGELKATKTVEIRSQVEGVTTIISIVPEGKRVKEGEVLVKLASDAIQDKLEDARIRVENAMAAKVNAEQSVKIQQMQNESDLATAKLNMELTKADFEQFDKADAKTERDTRKTTLDNAETDRDRKKEDLDRVLDLKKKDFVTQNDVLDATIAYRDALNKLDTAKTAVDVLKLYEEPTKRLTLQRKKDEAAAEFERTRLKADAAMRWKEADLRAKESTLRVETARKDLLEQQLAACTIKAPQPGMVVYQSSVSQGGWNNNLGPIEEGAQVRQNQTLIQLPDTTRMIVEVRIAEQLTDRIAVGQPVLVTVDALPGQVLTGKVDTISVLPDSSNRWLNPNLKEYITQISLDQTPTGSKPGMTARAQIQASHLESVIAVPPQAVFMGGGQSYVFVGTPKQYEKRVVKLGLSSAEYVQITDGLASGQTVLLSRPKDAPEDAPASAPAKPGKGKRAREGGAAT